MAKRRRLIPAQMTPIHGGSPLRPGGQAAVLQATVLQDRGLQGAGVQTPAPQSAPRAAQAPIARVAGEASATSALQEVAAVLESARAEGRLVQRLALDQIDTGYLVRDRIETDEEALGQLIDSLRAHGQRAPVEVAELAPDRYGLISGWRRIAALRRLHAETGDARFATVLALLRRPETAEAAYVAMVEENEVRLGLSYYERARIAARAADLGVFDSEKQALQRLFASASRARRSKIGSFLGIYRALDGVLRFPQALPERLGLGLAHLLEAAPEAAARLVADLAARPATDAAGEQARLAAAVAAAEKPAPAAGRAAPPSPAPSPALSPAPGRAPASSGAEEVRSGVFLAVSGGWTKPVLTLSGPNVGPEFRERLLHWLQNG